MHMYVYYIFAHACGYMHLQTGMFINMGMDTSKDVFLSVDMGACVKGNNACMCAKINIHYHMCMVGKCIILDVHASVLRVFIHIN